jgi:hypothetical protein
VRAAGFRLTARTECDALLWEMSSERVDYFMGVIVLMMAGSFWSVSSS